MYLVADINVDICAATSCKLCTQYCPEANTILYSDNLGKEKGLKYGSAYVAVDRCKGCAQCVWVCDNMAKHHAITMTMIDQLPKAAITDRITYLDSGGTKAIAAAVEKAKAVLEIAAQIPNVLIIPMPDYRPKYPKVDPEEVINPNHPNLTIWGNKIEACIFVGVHCHYANLTLKMIRAGTNCCTAALCAEQGHEDAMLSVHDMDAAKLRRVAQVFKRVREQMGINLPSDGKNVRYTGLQSRVNGNETHIDPPVAVKPGGPPAGGHMPPEGQMPHSQFFSNPTR